MRKVIGKRLAVVLCAVLVTAAVDCGREEPADVSRNADKSRLENNAAPEPKAQLPIHYELVKTIALDMASPKGIAIDREDRLYIAGAEGVRVLDAAGKLLRVIRTPRPAVCVALDGRGGIYVGYESGVAVFTEKGERITSWGEEGKAAGQMRVVTSIAVSEANVYVADAGNRCVHRFDTTGDFINEIGKKDPEANVPGIIVRQSPMLDLAVDSSRLLHVTNPGRLRVERYKADGTLLDYWGRPGRALADFCGCCNPTNILLLGDGQIATSEKAIPRVKVYGEDRKLLALIDSEHFSKKAFGLDLARDSKKRILVLDSEDRKIKVFKRKH